MAMEFREALLKKLSDTDVSLRAVAHGSGVSYDQLKRLKAREGASTNVDDAKRISDFFGVTLDQFLESPELSGPLEVISVYNQLDKKLKARLEAYGVGLLESQGQPPLGGESS